VIGLGLQSDKPLAEYGELAATVEAGGFASVCVFNDLWFQPPLPDPAGDADPLGLEELVEIALGDEVRCGEPRRRQIGVAEVGVDVGAYAKHELSA